MDNQHKKILQVGLYCTSDKEAEQMIKRVTDFNKYNLGNAIQLDVMPFEDGDPKNGISDPHYKFRFLFPSREIQRNFWTN